MRLAALLFVVCACVPALAEVAPSPPQALTAVERRAEDFGAKGDGVTDNTKALQAAIDATAAVHGVLVLKPGVYRTGSLFLKSGMTLRLDDGVTLLGAQDIVAYPRQPTRIAGVEMVWPAALLNVYRQHDVRIVSKGTIDGDGKVFWQRFFDVRQRYEPKGLRWAADYDAERPRLIQIYESERVELGGGLALLRSGFWTVQIVYSHDVRISGVTIRNNIDGKGPSTDGIDIDSSRIVLVEDADIDVNDDALCLKAGRDADGLRVNRPTEHVLIRNSVIRAAAAGITFGSETSGGIHDVEAYGLTVIGPAGNGIFFKSAQTRGGTISDIRLHDMRIQNVAYAIRIDFNWYPQYSYARIPPDVATVPAHWRVLATPVPRELGLPHVRNVRIANIKATAGTAVRMEGYPEAPVEDITLDGIDIAAKAAGAFKHVRNVVFTHTVLTIGDGTMPSREDADVKGLD